MKTMELLMHASHTFDAAQMAEAIGLFALAAERKAGELSGVVEHWDGRKLMPSRDWSQVAESLGEAREQLRDLAALERREQMPPIIGRKDD